MEDTARKTIVILQDECDAIENLYEKKVALENLIKTIDIESNEGIYNRIISDYGKITIEFNDWWEKIFVTYSIKDGNYHIDFENKQLIEN